MSEKSNKLIAAISIALLMLVPGPLCYLLYRLLINGDSSFAMGFIVSPANLAIVLATFAFTMLGFLAAIIALMFAVATSRVMKVYREKGYMPFFFSMYVVTILCLMVTFLLALVALGNSVSYWFIRLAVMSAVNNVIQIALISITIVGLCVRAINEHHEP